MSRGAVSLEFLGLEGGGICVGVMDFVDADSSTPGEELRANFEKDLEAGGIWLEAVESLDALTGRTPWPPGPTSTRLVSVELVGDEVKTFTKTKPYGDSDEYVEVKEDSRVIEFKVCGPDFEPKPESNYLVAVVHVHPSEQDQPWNPDLADVYGPVYEEKLRMQHDALFVWALTEDGTVDLSK